MAARVMGIYTSEKGIALVVITGPDGKKLLHASWHPAFSQPDGSILYPAEEIHKQVQALSPDSICLFDTEFPIIPFPMTLPKMKSREITQALKMELESRNVTDLMDPVVGFCLGTEGKAGGRRANLKGFGLAAERSDLRALRQKYRPLGVEPDLLSLPIYALALAFIHETAEADAVLFLADGALAMTARTRAREIQSLEVFYGGEEALSERIGALLPDNPGQKLYGFEIVPRDTRSPFPRFQETSLPGEGPQDVKRLIQRRQPVSPIALAASLARLPFLLGSPDLGGVHAAETTPKVEKESRKMMGLAAGLVALVLIGIGAVFGVLAGMDTHIYKTQQSAIHRAVASVLRHAPPLAGVEVIESKILEYGRLRKHLTPMLSPSTLRLPARSLPVLERVGGLRMTDISSYPDHVKILFIASRSLDTKRLKANLKKAGAKDVAIKSLKPVSAKANQAMTYVLTIGTPLLPEGTPRAE